MCSKVVYWYRATSFGTPCGPWRGRKRHAWEDLAAQGLGDFDDYGVFYVMVPGGLDVRSEWVPFEEAVYLSAAS